MTYNGRLRDLEAEAFRTRRTLATHSEQLTAIREQQHSAAAGSTGSPSNAPGECTITHRLHLIEQHLDTIADVLSALARAHGIGPEPTG